MFGRFGCNAARGMLSWEYKKVPATIAGFIGGSSTMGNMKEFSCDVWESCDKNRGPRFLPLIHWMI